jgi:hypothetical protein
MDKTPQHENFKQHADSDGTAPATNERWPLDIL